MTGARYRALALLTFFGVKGRLRQIGRAFRTVRGVIAFIFGFAIFGSWLGMSFVGLLMHPRSDDPSNMFFEKLPIETIQIYIALLLLGYSLITFIFRKQGAGVQFKPAEVDFLFAGPYGRRELLLYKICSLFGSVLFSSLIFSVILSRVPVPWPILFIGLALAITFAILLNVLASVATLTVSTRLHRPVVRAAAAIVAVLIALAAYAALSSTDLAGATERGLEIAKSPIGRVFLMPFMTFARAITAPDYAAFAVYGSLAVAINMVVVGLILLLDADYYESGIDASRKTYERLRRIRQGDLFAADVKRAASWSLPELPRLGGVGPVAWRQGVTAIRSLPRMLLISLLFMLPGAVFMVRGKNEQEILQLALSYLGAMLFVFMPSAFRFDFRSDLNKMGWLKALPIPPWAIVTGQLLPATCMLVVAEALLVTVIATSADRWIYLALLPLLPAAAFVMFAVENVIFLFFPTRRFAMYPGDFQNLGYTYLVAFAKIIVLGIIFTCTSV